MKLLLIDLETTGLDLAKDRPIEYCFQGWDTVTGVTQEAVGYFWEPGYPAISESAQKAHKITQTQLEREGEQPAEVLRRLAASLPSIDYVVGHNIRSFDWPVLCAEAERQGVVMPEVKLIDTRYDLPYPANMKCRKLGHLALDHGIAVDPAKLHGAAADVDFMKRIMECYDLEQVAVVSQAPFVVVRALVSYDNRQQAKDRGYSWEKVGEKVYPKQWVKRMRDFEVAEEILKAPFTLSRLEG